MTKLHTGPKPTEYSADRKIEGAMADSKPNVQTLEAEKSKEEDGEELKLQASVVKDENGFVYYKCRFCGLTFNYMTTLKAHERVHDVDQPYLCGKCGEAFRYMCELEYHCNLCRAAGFHQRQYLQKNVNGHIEKLCMCRKIVGRCPEVISAIVQHCKKLEHLQLVDYRREFGAEIYATTLRLDSLPNLYSLAIWAEMYSKEQATELINRIIGIGKIQYIGMIAQASLEPEVLLEMLRRCKSIRSVALDFGAIDSDFYSKICQMVDEIDEEDKKQRELPGMTHPIVEVQYNQELAENTTTPYKWLRFKSEIENQEWISAICEKWKFGWLSAGKP
ncbi:zinc finger protein unc-98 [Ditylenchus destructor]|uniref:Zinc finger protein unc-98 n=1 Tax=Ditylenchus destructor TaxID=166010 RepID=A0AAD4MFS7_9BILA|nr:zinc finger protein unc-98 [Ditylenchus destructor]